VFCPPAQRKVLRNASEAIFPLATNGSRFELSRRVMGERLFSQRHKWLIT
jgi:hypothetical protein